MTLRFLLQRSTMQLKPEFFHAFFFAAAQVAFITAILSFS